MVELNPALDPRQQLHEGYNKLEKLRLLGFDAETIQAAQSIILSDLSKITWG